MSKSAKSTKKRVNVQSLPMAEKELTNKEAKKVKGGSYNEAGGRKVSVPDGGTVLLGGFRAG